MRRYDWYTPTAAHTLKLVRDPSVNATEGEAALAHRLYQQLAGLAYFQANPHHLRLVRTEDDPIERYSVLALVRGEGPRTAILMGHLDTVGIEDYGPLRPLACDPERLGPALVQQLAETEPAHPAIGDLTSGRYMAGRGALDMKAGAAAHLAVLERFAAQEQRQGNLLLLITPDEEDTSKGILSALKQLPALAAAEGLTYEAAINTDYTSPLFPGDPSRYVYLGTVGKLLPSFYIVGRETHVGEPFQGFDPNTLAAELTRRFNYNTTLCDAAEGEMAPPPISLKQGDLKEGYTVQTAVAAWAYYNYLTVSRSPSEVVTLFHQEAEAAFRDVLAQIRDQAARVGQTIPDWEPRVLLYEELHRLALERGGPAAEAVLRETTAQLLADPGARDLRVFSRRVIERLWPFAGVPGPAVVMFLASLYSPRVRITGKDEREQRLLKATRGAVDAVRAAENLPLQLKHFFPYIADMSFLGGGDTEEDLRVLAANMPAWGSLYKVDHRFYAALDIPVINVGPYGHDAHKRTERVEMDYSFRVVPELIWQICGGLLAWT